MVLDSEYYYTDYSTGLLTWTVTLYSSIPSIIYNFHLLDPCCVPGTELNISHESIPSDLHLSGQGIVSVLQKTEAHGS